MKYVNPNLIGDRPRVWRADPAAVNPMSGRAPAAPAAGANAGTLPNASVPAAALAQAADAAAAAKHAGIKILTRDETATLAAKVAADPCPTCGSPATRPARIKPRKKINP